MIPPHELYAAWEDCQQKGWDGYDAVPVSLQELENIIGLLAVMPDDMPVPECLPSPDGIITLEWYKDQKNIVVMFVEKDQLVYLIWNNFEKPITGRHNFKKHGFPKWLASMISMNMQGQENTQNDD